MLDAGAICPECGSSAEARAAVARLRRLWRNDILLLVVLAGGCGAYFWGSSTLRLAGSAMTWLNDPWGTYSDARFQSAVAARRKTAVLFDADWCLGAGTARRPAIRSELAGLLREQGHVLLFADLTVPSASTQAVHALAGNPPLPCVAIFGPDGRLVSIEVPDHAHRRLSAEAAGRR